jgi:hypothetical protein
MNLNQGVFGEPMGFQDDPELCALFINFIPNLTINLIINLIANLIINLNINLIFQTLAHDVPLF